MKNKSTNETRSKTNNRKVSKASPRNSQQLDLELAGLALSKPSLPLLASKSQNTAGAPSVCPDVFSRLSPAKPTPVYDTYWRFAAERQEIFFKRLEGAIEPWTEDPILQTYKFTNAYRASDRVSQYLIRHVIYRDDLPNSPEEVFFRILLFKLFNRVETWELLERSVGTISLEEFSYKRYDAIFTNALRTEMRVYSAAYIMPPGGRTFGHPLKHQNHLELLALMLRESVPKRLQATKRMQDGFTLLKGFPTIGDFLAYQFITDLNYSELTNFTEREFVIPGPGARDGLRKCFFSFGGLNEAETIRFMADSQEQEFERLGLRFRSLWGRPLQLIDCQNLFCETDKYARVAHPDIKGISGRVRIKQQFMPKDTSPQPIYPPKWRLKIPSFASTQARQRSLL